MQPPDMFCFLRSDLARFLRQILGETHTSVSHASIHAIGSCRLKGNCVRHAVYCPRWPDIFLFVRVVIRQSSVAPEREPDQGSVIWHLMQDSRTSCFINSQWPVALTEPMHANFSTNSQFFPKLTLTRRQRSLIHHASKGVCP